MGPRPSSSQRNSGGDGRSSSKLVDKSMRRADSFQTKTLAVFNPDKDVRVPNYSLDSERPSENRLLTDILSAVAESISSLTEDISLTDPAANATGSGVRVNLKKRVDRRHTSPSLDTPPPLSGRKGKNVNSFASPQYLDKADTNELPVLPKKNFVMTGNKVQEPAVKLSVESPLPESEFEETAYSTFITKLPHRPHRANTVEEPGDNNVHHDIRDTHSTRANPSHSPSPSLAASPTAQIHQHSPRSRPSSRLADGPHAFPLDAQLLLAKDGLEREFMSSLDTWSGLYRRAIMSDFVNIKNRLSQEHASQLANHRGVDAAIISSLEEEMVHLKEDIQSGKNTIARRCGSMEAASSHIFHLQNRCVIISCFGKWKMKLQLKREQEYKWQLACRHRTSTVMQNTLLVWYRTTALSCKAVLTKNITRDAENRIQGRLDEYEAAFQHMQRTLDVTMAKLAESERARELQEAEMKKTFMRGVCALNMEAMSMFDVPGIPGSPSRLTGLAPTMASKEGHVQPSTQAIKKNNRPQQVSNRGFLVTRHF